MGTQYGIKVLSPDWKIDVLGEEHGFENLTIQGIWIIRITPVTCHVDTAV